MGNDKKALIALMDLVLALADSVVAMEGQCSPRGRRVQDGATRLRTLGAVVADGQAARTAVAATERRMRAWQGLADMKVNVVQQGSGESWANLPPLEGDDSRVTDGHSDEHRCCGGKPDCGCARSVGG